jgi:hypothetical protein
MPDRNRAVTGEIYGLLTSHPVMCMWSRRYRKNAEECLDRAAQARYSDDSNAWLSIAEDWIRLAVDVEAAGQHQSERSAQPKEDIIR